MFQVSISMIHDLYIALCAHSPSQIILLPYIRPLYPLLPLTPFSSGHHHLFLWDSAIYHTFEWQHTVRVFFCLTYFAQYNSLRVLPCCCKWQYFIFSSGGVVFIVYMYHISVSDHLSKGTLAVPMSWPAWIMLQWT